MVLFLSIITIAFLSVVISYFSIKNDMKKIKQVDDVKKDLAKGRVIYYAPSAPLEENS